MDDTNATTKAKTTASMPIISLLELPKLEVPAAFREVARTSAAQTKDACEKAKAAAANATELIEETYAIGVRGTLDYNLKIFEAARANANAAFDFVSEFMSVTSLSEAVELTTAHGRKRLEAVAEQTKELAAAAQKLGTDAAQPIKTSVAKTFRKTG